MRAGSHPPGKDSDPAIHAPCVTSEAGSSKRSSALRPFGLCSPLALGRACPSAELTPDLREHYNPQDERYDERYPPLPATAPTPASPVDSSVPIPSSLQALATPAPNAPYLAPLPPMSEEFPGESVSLDRGEMGGKRRKAPHERAGWKEILEEEERQKMESNAAAAAEAAAADGQKEEEYGNKMKRAKLR